MPSDDNLRDLVAAALRGDGEWDSLSESRKAVWRADADRAINAMRSAPGYAQGFEACREAAVLTVRGFDAASNSKRMMPFIQAGVVVAVYDRDNEIADAIAALPAPAGAEDWQPIPERMREALEYCRSAISHLGDYVLGGVSYDRTDGSGPAPQHPIRDELLAKIDEALRAGDNHASDGKERDFSQIEIDKNGWFSWPKDPTPPDREALAERLQKRLGNRTVSVGPGIYEDIRDAIIALRWSE